LFPNPPFPHHGFRTPSPYPCANVIGLHRLGQWPSPRTYRSILFKPQIAIPGNWRILLYRWSFSLCLL
jgi:hypothetical protein